MDADRFFVVTGGPGAGKTMPEAGRAIIRDQVAIGGAALPCADRALFAELMLAADIRSYREAQRRPGVVLFDRGVADVLGYLRLCELEIRPHVEKAARDFRYAKQVFIAPPWPEIFVGDAERKQSLAEAEATFLVMAEVYTALGYGLIELPRAPLGDRVRFVRDIVGH